MLVVFVCLLGLSGCKRPVENPETLDPIYLDLIAQGAAANSRVEVQKKKIEDLAAKLPAFEPRDPMLKRTRYEKENFERALVQLEQEAKYFEIRIQQRRFYDRESYAKAFKADQPWPPENEFQEYKDARHLKSLPRDWDKRVPVDTAHNKPVPDKKAKKEEPKKEE